MKHSQYLHLELCYPIQMDIHKDNTGKLVVNGLLSQSRGW